MLSLEKWRRDGCGEMVKEELGLVVHFGCCSNLMIDFKGGDRFINRTSSVTDMQQDKQDFRKLHRAETNTHLSSGIH